METLKCGYTPYMAYTWLITLYSFSGDFIIFMHTSYPGLHKSLQIYSTWLPLIHQSKYYLNHLFTSKLLSKTMSSFSQGGKVAFSHYKVV